MPSPPLLGGVPVVGQLLSISGTSTPTSVIPAGSAGGGSIGQNAIELGLVSYIAGQTPPFEGGGNGPNGAIFALYDGPTDAAGGYHVFYLSPNNENNVAEIGFDTAAPADEIDLIFSYGGTTMMTVSSAGVAIPTLDVSSLSITYPLRVITVAGAVTIVTTDYFVVLKKTVPETTTVTLPASGMTTGQQFAVVDGSGNANSYNITIDGNGNTIRGSSTATISLNYGSAFLVWDGTTWDQLNPTASLPGTQPLRVITAAGSVTVSATSDYYIVLNKTIGAATTVTLPASGMVVGQQFVIKDGKGDANSNNIQIAGNGNNIDGSTPLIINTAYGFAGLVWNGTQWNQVA